jgi:NADPH:quinone reductase-like Zn-dependent oxidoreductase
VCEWCRSGHESLCNHQEIPGIDFPGGYAEYAKVPARGVMRIPDGVTLESAAAKNSLTAAWHALVGRAQLQANEWVLVNAAGSGLGSAGVNVARLVGAHVIASAGSKEKLERASQAGAEHTIDYTTEELATRVREVTEGRGVDVVLECVGGDIFTASLEALAKNGRLVCVGAHAGEVVPVDLVRFFRSQLTVLGSLRATAAEMREVLAHLADGSLAAVVDRMLPLSRAADAHQALQDRQLFGKVLLVP